MAKDIAELVAESRTAQGLPATVEDPATLARVAALIAASMGDAEDAAA